MKRLLALSLLAVPLLHAQEPPRAVEADPALRADPSNDFFLRGKNVYDSAQASTDFETRIAYYQRAAAIFAEYLTNFPNHPNAEMAWWYLGNSYYQSGNPNEARRCFSTLLNRYGQGKWAAAAAYTMAADHYNKGEYAFAAPMFERYAANAGKPTERARGALFAAQSKIALGHLAVERGKLEDALAWFEDAANGNHAPKDRGEAMLQAALTATKLGQTQLADDRLNQIMRSPGMEEFRPDAQTALMANLFAKKEYDEVIRIFRSSATKAEGEKEAARLMIAARSYMRLKQPSQALTLFREVERLVKPESETAFEASYYRLLCFYQIEGRHVPDQVDAFIQLYRKLHPEDRRIHTALMMKAESLYASGKVADAAKTYSEINAAVVSEKNRAGLFFQRGWCLAEAGDPQGAIRSLSEFISRYPDDPRVPSALAKRARAYVDASEPAKAIADFDRLTTAKGTSADLASFAWLESARMRRSEGNIPDMITRYKALLQNVEDLSENLQAEANYWIGWGLVKSNSAGESVSFLEKARQLRPKAYAKHAGILLALGYFASQEPEKLSNEIQNAIDNGYASEIPDQALQWSGMQSFNSGDYHAAVRSLGQIANDDDPRSTPKEVWRYLTKALIETGDGSRALTSVNHLLDVEDNPAWKADALLDRARALLILDRPAESRKSVDEAMELRPQGRTSAGLRIVSGDLEMKAGDPRKAAAEYLIVVNFHDDKELKPLALSRLVEALETQGDTAAAGTYRQQLASEFPGWKNP